MPKYSKNNIIFRIASSDAIGKFKSTQAHAFVQLARKELNFNESAREVVLLEYDRYSQWIFRIERICQTAGEGDMTSQLKTAIKESFDEEVRLVETVIEAHSDVFHSKVVEFIKIVHGYMNPLVSHRFDVCMRKPIDIAFSEIVLAVSNYLQHILAALHEFNNNILSKVSSPFVSFTGFNMDLDSGDDRFIPLFKRATFFSNNDCGNSYIFKNYSSEDIYNDASLYMERFGIVLLPEEADVTATV